MMLIETISVTIVADGLIHLDQYTQEELSNALAENSNLMFLAGIGSMLQILGGMAIPIFAFLLVEGFRNTSNYRNYLLSVVLFALISEVPFDLAMNQKLWDFSGQNAMVSMAISLLMLYFLDMTKENQRFSGKLMRVCVVLGAVIWAALFRAEYGLCIVLLVAIFHLFYTKNVWKTILGCLVSLLYITGPLAFYGIWCYNGERTNKIPKYAYYAFYPLHLLILALIVRFFF